jgi:hypothetical protein
LDLREFYFADPRMFVVPIEHLSAAGIDANFAAALAAARGVSPRWIELFDAAFATYWRRVGELAARAPASWFPPRLAHVCIVTDSAMTRPYYQPFARSSWLLHAEDFDPDRSSVELGAYLFAHAERLFLTKNPAAACALNLSWFLVLDGAARKSFTEGAAKSTRPDAAAFRHLAGALEWLARLWHQDLRPPPEPLPEPCGRLDHARLVVPLALQQELEGLAAAVQSAAAEHVRGYFTRHAGTGHGDAVAAWLAAERPSLLVTHEGEIVWDPDAPDDVGRLRADLETVGEATAASLRDDFAVIAERTQRFLAALREPEALAAPDYLDQEAGTYIHPTRKLVAYDLALPPTRLREPSPPYERPMLAARTLHEWGHLAADGGLVPVPAELGAEHQEARAALAALFEGVWSGATDRMREIGREELARLGARGKRAGDALVDFLLTRISDYQANLVARRFLDEVELETYVRNNVATLVQEKIGPLAQLTRYAYEMQYLRLAKIGDPVGWLLDSTWLRERLVAPGLCTEQQVRAIFDAVARLLATYRVEENAFV